MAHSDRDLLPRFGVWWLGFREADLSTASRAAMCAEHLGFGAAWVPGRSGGDVLDVSERLLATTRELVVATGVVNIRMHQPAEVAGRAAAMHARFGGRFVLGLGVGHRELVPAAASWASPLAAINGYLDELQGEASPLPSVVLAALGPAMLALARDRVSGVHPYLVPPEHTALARQILGDKPLLATELHIVRVRDAAHARWLARRVMGRNLALDNYRRNFLRLGYSTDDFESGGSDRLIDSVFAWGSDTAIVRRAREHLEAGADHVCFQVLTSNDVAPPILAWAALAEEIST